MMTAFGRPSSKRRISSRSGIRNAVGARRSGTEVVVLDMVQNALREYEAVSVEPTLADGSTRTAIDVRRFGWMRPLAGRLRVQFRRTSRRSTPATRRRARRGPTPSPVPAGTSRPREAVARCSAAQQARREAPPAARDAAARLAQSADRRDRHRAAGRRVRRAALHAPEGHHRACSSRARPRASSKPTVVAIFWVDAEDHDWDEIAKLYGARPGVPAAHDHAPPA